MVNKLGSLCAVLDCNNYSQQKNRRTFHRFPKDQMLCSEWVQRCDRKDLEVVFRRRGSVYLNYNHRMCSDHFVISDFTNPNQKSQGLKRGTLPTVNLPDGVPTAPSRETEIYRLQARQAELPPLPVRQTEIPPSLVRQTEIPPLQVRQMEISPLQARKVEIHTLQTKQTGSPTLLVPKTGTSLIVVKRKENPTLVILQKDTSTLPVKATETLPEKQISTLQLEQTDDQDSDLQPASEMVEVEVEIQEPPVGTAVSADASKSGRKPKDQSELIVRLRKNLNNAYKRSYKHKVIIRKLRKENAELKEQLSELSPISKLVCENKFSDSFILNQLKQQSKKGKGRRYSTADKNFALDLYRCSPKAYGMLSSKFCLPTIRLLQLWQQSLNVIAVDFDSE